MNQGDGKNKAGRAMPAESGGGAAGEPRDKGPGTAGATQSTASRAHSGTESSTTGRQEVEASAGWGRFLVAPRPLGLLPGGVPPIEFPLLIQLLEEDEQVEVLSRLRPARSRGLGAIAEPHPFCPPVAVVAMPAERAAALAANPQVVVEADQPLIYPVVNPLVPTVAAADPGLAVPLAEPATFTVRVTGGDLGDPVPGAHVWAIGTTAPAHAVTDRTGSARLTLAADTPQTIQALHVRPAGGYWPQVEGTSLPLDGKAETVVRLRPLSDTFENFPVTPVVGWGAQAMRLTQIPPTFRGHGVKIALLDSGIAVSHPDLKGCVVAGQDFIVGGEHGWDQDATGHGTWCAGVIAAADNQTGIAGIAGDAHLYALKLFPGGYTSHLLEALDWCAGNEIDLAQVNLAVARPSQLLAWKILDTRTAGTTVIAPAGDTGTTPAFPAALPTVIAVGALAHTNTTPDGPRQTAPGFWSGPYTPDFSPIGADLIAPGAAVVTTSVDGDYTVADGTALAAAHTTALAALLLAHHDQLRTPLTTRTQARVDHLTALLRASCHPVPGADPVRAGAGLPDAPVALGTATSFTTGLMAPSWPPASPYATPRT